MDGGRGAVVRGQRIPVVAEEPPVAVEAETAGEVPLAVKADRLSEVFLLLEAMFEHADNGNTVSAAGVLEVLELVAEEIKARAGG